MASKPGRKQHGSRSTIVAIAMVAAAGLVTWFGTAPRGTATAPMDDSPIVMAAAPTATDAVGDITAPPQPLAGTLPTRIVVTKAGIDAPIDEVGVVKDQGTWVWQTAWQAAGHHLDSARPGQPGNMVITGHVSVADSRNLAAFKTLDKVAVGDEVDVYSGAQVFRYQVDKVDVVAPTNVKILRSDHRSTVTMITCTHDLKNRLVVTGTLL
jgi:sortase A